jgi:MAP/microtubule affinity-regulating kinase
MVDELSAIPNLLAQGQGNRLLGNAVSTMSQIEAIPRIHPECVSAGRQFPANVTPSECPPAPLVKEEMKSINSYILDKVLGFGAYASVKLAKLKSDPTPDNPVWYAIKTYEKYKLIEPQKMKNVQREISLLTKLQHPNIIRLFCSIDTPKQIYLVMEYIGQTNLLGFARSKPGRRLEEKEARTVFRQIVAAIDYCHANQIIHRDIKLDNILVDPATLNVKVIDFGFAINMPDDKKIGIYCGTPSYMAPEILSKAMYKPKGTDVWALGVVLCYMLCGTFPFKGNEDKEILKLILKGKVDFGTATPSNEAKDLISKMLTVNPDERITTAEVKKLAYTVADTV